MKLKINQFFLTLILIFGILVLLPLSVQAGAIPVSVRAILPENQLGDVDTFYQLKVKPGQKQELELEVTNTSDQKVKVDLSINSASTGMTGNLIYNLPSKNRDSSLKVALTDIASVDERVEIPAKEKKTVKIKLNVPAEAFEGVILGAVRVDGINSLAENEKNKEEQTGFTINNKYAYAIAIQLQETDELNVTPEIKLTKALFSQIAGRNTIKVYLQNPTPMIINDLTYEAKVTRKNKEEILYENKVKDYRFAPNSTMVFPIEMGAERVKPGDYSLKLLAKSGETDKEWRLDYSFTLSKEQAKKLNETAVDIDQSLPTWLVICLTLIISLLIVLIIGMFVWFIKKKKRSQEKKIKKKKKKKNK
ncbi:DUF916 and DUF3324 domain-containing protein [Vagococcus sp.]|uniref:DUF916 and DUF3324 domain-containing protein n=1 Tax=Vagococcus sp. TaxID=1933889 RepID=UPI003F94723C